MSKTQKDLIEFRLSRADESLNMARLALENSFFNSAVSELYYTCFYLITALFAQQDIHTSTHKAVKSLFNLHFVKEGKVEERWGALLKEVFNKRQQGDYGDYILMEASDARRLLQEVQQFRNIILQQLQTF